MPKMTPDEARFVARQRVARLATVDPSGAPHVVPVVFAIDGDTIYTPIDLKPKSASPRELRRVRNVTAEPRVQLLVDRYDDDWTRLGYVQLRGRADLIERGNEHERALVLLEAKYGQYRDLPLAGRPVMRIGVEHIVSWGRLEG